MRHVESELSALEPGKDEGGKWVQGNLISSGGGKRRKRHRQNRGIQRENKTKEKVTLLSKSQRGSLAGCKDRHQEGPDSLQNQTGQKGISSSADLEKTKSISG